MASLRKREAGRRRLEANKRQVCNVTGCTKRRHGLSYFCHAHAFAARHHGHPLARKIKKKEYEHERKHVVRFLRLHSAHGAVNAAYELAGLWLREAEAGQPVPAQEQMARLAAGGVTGAEIIEEVLALWLYSRWHPTGLPDDIRLTKALGTNVLLLVPREASSELTPGGEKKYRRLGALIRAEVGEHIRRVFGVFALNVLTAIERQIRAKQDAAQALRTPFPDPLSTPTAPPEGDAGPH